LARFIPVHLVPEGPVLLVGDDTVDGHPGKRAYGKARHRDPVRSSHAYTAWKYGHRRVVLAVLVRFPWAGRPWALPVLVDLHRSEEGDRERGRPHRTPARLMCRLLRLVLSRFPGRRFVVVGDSGSGPHEVARSCHRHRDRLTLVSKMHPAANRFDPPPPYRGIGRPRIKGERRPRPREGVAAASHRTALTVGWYGGGTRLVEVVSGTGPWSKAGHGLVPIRWVFVHDLEGSHRDEDFYATDPGGDRHPLRRPLEDRGYVPGAALAPRIGDDAGVVPEDGGAGGAVPVRALFGRRPAGSGAARVEADDGGPLAGQGRSDVLGCAVGGAAVAVGRVGFPTGRGRRHPGKTPRAAAGAADGNARASRVALSIRHQSR
jgi:hypothetical protein